MRCPPCYGTGVLSFSIGHCALCKGTGALSNIRANNPPCVACHQTGVSHFRIGFCEICGGWGRLPTPPTPDVSIAAILPAAIKALETFKTLPPPPIKTIDVEPQKVAPVKLFISHAAADKVLASKFVDFLRLGAGISHKNIFYSSAKGTIRNGDFFVENIVNEINAAHIVIALLSKEYFASHFCLAEAGAALARKRAGLCEFFSFVVPPASFSDLDGMLLGVQSGSILDLPIHGDMKDRIQSDIPKNDVPGTAVWDEKRNEFLASAQQAVSVYETKAALALIGVNNYQWKHEPGSPEHVVYVNFKIRINLRNGLPYPIHIESGSWESGSDGIPVYPDFHPIQRLKWHLKENDPESDSLTVPPGSVFRTWVGLAPNTTCAESLKRSAAKQTGTLNLRLKASDHLLNHAMRF